MSVKELTKAVAALMAKSGLNDADQRLAVRRLGMTDKERLLDANRAICTRCGRGFAPVTEDNFQLCDENEADDVQCSRCISKAWDHLRRHGSPCMFRDTGCTEP